MRIQLLATQRCNAACEHCDKAVGYKQLDGLEFTAAHMRFYAGQLEEQRIRVRRLTISGGEPVVNRELQEILKEAPPVSEGRLLTNDMPSTKAKRDAIRLPPNWRWVPSPLDDPHDARSGKSDPSARDNGRTHHAYWISPADYGYDARFEKCSVKWYCGRGLDAKGWSICGQAPILGRLLDVDPYPSDRDNVDIRKHVLTPVEDLCRHCLYGLPRNESRELRAEAAARGESVSSTYRAAFERKSDAGIRTRAGDGLERGEDADCTGGLCDWGAIDDVALSIVNGILTRPENNGDVRKNESIDDHASRHGLSRIPN